MKKILSCLLSLSLFFSCTSASITKKYRSKACPLGAKASVFAGSMTATLIAAASLEASHQLNSDLPLKIGAPVGLYIGFLTGFLSDHYKTTPFPLNKKKVVLASLITGLISGLAAYRITPILMKNNTNPLVVSNYKNKAALLTTALTTLITGYILNEYTPESVYYETLKLLQEILQTEIFTQSFETNELFFAYIEKLYNIYDWPLVLAYNAIYAYRYKVLNLAHTLKIVEYACKNDNYKELIDSCLEQQEQVKQFDTICKSMLFLLKNHPEFSNQLKLQEKFENQRHVIA